MEGRNMFQPTEEKEFNSGLALIFQLDAIEKKLVEATVLGDIDMHYKILVAYFKTLVNQINDKEEAIQIKNWEKVRQDYYKIKQLMHLEKKVPIELSESLDAWEIELRNLKQKHGLGMPAKDPRYVGTKR